MYDVWIFVGAMAGLLAILWIANKTLDDMRK